MALRVTAGGSCVALLCAALASCGGGAGSGRARSPCPPRVVRALGAGTRAALVAREPDRFACAYRTPGVRGATVHLTVDTAPQAARRWQRWVVERGQAYLGAPRAQLPEVLAGLGEGAAWVPASRELVATGGGRLVTVVVGRAASGAADPRATAVAVARAALPRGASGLKGSGP